MTLRGDAPTVGILGGGQLARMMALAGWPLGVRFIQYAPAGETAGGIVDTMHGDFGDRDALREFAGRVDVVTYESENIPFDTVEFLEGLVALHPPPKSLVLAGDRWAEKDLFTKLDIPTSPYAKLSADDDAAAALEHVGVPAVCKLRRLGYDGRGQLVCRTADELRGAWAALGEVPLLCERWVPFTRELSVVGVRARNGEIRCWTPGENVHEHGILRTTVVPAPDLDPRLHELAQDYLTRIMEAMDHVGVLALEMFQHEDGLLANEIAPRVHNTGHWTIEGAITSQFENHVRAILGWPLGSTAHYGHAAMLNVIGETPDITDLLAVDGAHIHVYGKTPRAGRKLGHITVTADSHEHASERLAQLRGILDRNPTA